MNTFECDKNKARTNYRKHGIKFTDAARALNLQHTLTGRSSQPNTQDEDRNLSITSLADGRAIVMVWTPRKEHIRIISVRQARKKEKEKLNAYLRSLQ